MNKYLIITSIVLVSFLSCSEENTPRKEPEFYSKNNAGRWADKTKDHCPVVTFISENTIEVTVPLRPSKNPRHYIEIIALMEGENKQIAVHKFPFSFNRAKARFTLPDPSKKNYWVFAKCNKHDMWKTPVNPDDNTFK